MCTNMNGTLKYTFDFIYKVIYNINNMFTVINNMFTASTGKHITPSPNTKTHMRLTGTYMYVNTRKKTVITWW